MTSQKTAILTGCASGIGRCTAQLLFDRGWQIVATDINGDALREHANASGWQEPQVVVADLDVRDAAQWDRVFALAEERFGRADVVMNIAGVLIPGHVHEITVDHIDLQLDVNVKGVMLGTRAASQRMIGWGGGHIVNIASLAGMAPVPGLTVYSASKHAVRGFSIAAALDLKPYGVALTVVCPDAVATPMIDSQVPHDSAALAFTGPRLLTAEEVASLLVGKVLKKRPLEVSIPRSRGFLARWAGFAPKWASKMDPLLRYMGNKKQKRLRAAASDSESV